MKSWIELLSCYTRKKKIKSALSLGVWFGVREHRGISHLQGEELHENSGQVLVACMQDDI